MTAGNAANLQANSAVDASAAHGDQAPSAWVLRFAPMLNAGQHVLDVACGHGRHARLFAGRGCEVTAIDRDAAALAALRDEPGIHVVQADIENDPWPLPAAQFDAVVVTNYLHRPLFPTLLDALADGGLLLYETFAAGNAALGKPSNPAFLLRPGELLQLAAGLRIIAFEDGSVREPRPAVIQRLAARRQAPGSELPIGRAVLQ